MAVTRGGGSKFKLYVDGKVDGSTTADKAVKAVKAVKDGTADVWMAGQAVEEGR